MDLHWLNNITALKLIEKTDKIFYTKLQKFAQLLQDSDCHYVDKFYGNNRPTKLNDILITQTYTMDGILLSSINADRYGTDEPLAWICPGLYHESSAQCKNALYEYDNILYLSNTTIGAHCFYDEMKSLRNGQMLSQENGKIIEKVFGLPVHIFISTMNR